MNNQNLITCFAIVLQLCFISPIELNTQCAVDSVFDNQNVISNSIIYGKCLLAGDMDNDGDNDIIIAKRSPQNSKGIYIINNLDGLGSFGGENLIYHTPSETISTIALGDVDGDQDVDIILNRLILGGSVELILNMSDGVFSDGIMIGEDLGNSINDLAVYDIDTDGNVDIVLGRINDDLVTWFKNVDGSGENWLQNDIGQVGHPHSIEIEDIDSDGLLDILVCSVVDDYIVWFKNLGNDNFSDLIIIGTDVNGSADAVYSDINGDGINDIVAGANNNDIIYNYKGLGSGTFSSRQNMAKLMMELNALSIDNRVDLSFLSAGLYSIVLFTENDMIVHKSFIKE